MEVGRSLCTLICPRTGFTVALPAQAEEGTTAFFMAPPNPQLKDPQVVTSQQALEKLLSSGPKVTRRSD